MEHANKSWLAAKWNQLESISTNSGRRPELVRETYRWLEGISMDADLDAWQHEMAPRVEAL